jgi:ferrous iron transport protein B
MDRLLRKIGLSGRSFVPMLIGFGAPFRHYGNADARFRPRPQDDHLLTPFMSCFGKDSDLCGVLRALFFARFQALVMIGLYAAGIIPRHPRWRSCSRVRWRFAAAGSVL